MNIFGFVLAAGLGTRLRPLTDSCPKALVPVGDKPQLDHVLLHLAGAGIERVIVNTHYLAASFSDAWIRSQPVEVVRSYEPAILGTAGGIANVQDRLAGADAIVVWNADILADIDLRALTAAHFAHGKEITLVCLPTECRGNVRTGPDNEVVGIRNFDAAPAQGSANYAGIAVMSPGVVATFPKQGCLVKDVLIPRLAAGQRPAAVFRHVGVFHDIGSLETYFEANWAWLGSRSSYVAPDARVSQTVGLRRSILGAGCQVTGEGDLVDVVVWPGAIANAPLSRAIATHHGTVSLEVSGG